MSVARAAKEVGSNLPFFYSFTRIMTSNANKKPATNLKKEANVLIPPKKEEQIGAKSELRLMTATHLWN